MRLIKMFGLAAVAAVAAMAFIGATSASALNTQLCNTHTGLTCGSAATSVSQKGSGTLLGTLNITCDTVEGSGTPLGLANPQSVHITALTFESCETSLNDGCIVTTTELPLSNLNKTGLDEGTLTGTNGKTHVFCEDVLFTLDVDCDYDATGLQFLVGAQHLTATEQDVTEIGTPDSICPDEPKLDALLTTDVSESSSDNRYVLA